MKRAFRSRLLALCAVTLITVTWVRSKPVEAAPIAASVLNVGATVDIRCMLATSSLDFGVYSLTSPTPLDATANVTVNCTDQPNNAMVRIRMGQGQYPAPGSTTANPLRRMSNGSTGRMRYGIYQNAARTQIWGDTNGTAVAPGPAATYPLNTPVYGRIPALQAVMPGNYTDAVLATVTF